MKKNLFLFIIAAAVLTACQQSPKEVSPDIEAETVAVKEMVDAFLSNMFIQDVDSMATFITEDALLCGTDPSEFLDKEETIRLWKEMSAEIEIDFLVMDESVIKVSPDAKSAVAVVQYYIPMYFPEIPLRSVYWLNKTEGKWMISLWSIALIPKNEDLGTINDAMALRKAEK